MTSVNDAPASHKTQDSLKPNRFPDLRTAGRELALQLERHRHAADLLVLGIALAGVPVAHEVATHLGAPLDLVFIRRLLVPEGFGSQSCAVNAAGRMVLDDQIEVTASPSTPREYFIAEAIAELEQRVQQCRRERPAVELGGRTLILVDCGIRTGSTMKSAAQALRKLEPRQIIGAVPVSSPEGYAVIAPLCDELTSPLRPENFVNAGYWYRDFRRPGDDEVGDLLR